MVTRIGVIGAGQMGSGIAQVCARVGYEVVLVDISADALLRSIDSIGHGLDRLGTTRRLWNAHVNHGPGGDIAIPLLLSIAGYGLFFDNPRLALIDSGRTHDRVSFDYECDGDGFDLYVLGGGTLRGALATAAELLGRAPLPPRCCRTQRTPLLCSVLVG